MDLKDEIKNRLDIINIIGRYVDLKKSGSNYKANCPFHSENTPSFMVSQELQIFKCFGCGRSGDIFTFLMEMEGIEFKDALIQLAQETDIDISKYSFKNNQSTHSIYYEINETAQKFFSYTLLQLKVGKKALDYLKERGLSVDQINEFGIGYAPNSWNSLHQYLTKKGYKENLIHISGLIKKSPQGKYYDVYRGRIIFPLINQGGKIVGFSGRTIIGEEPKYINTKDTPVFKKSNFVFNLDKAKTEIRRKKEVIVVEGEFDTITPYIKGVKNVVALKGTSFTAGQAKLLKRYADIAYIFFDGDSAGNEAALRGIEVAQNLNLDVKISTLPRSFKDPDEAARESIDIIYKSIDEAIPAYDFYFEYILKKYDRTDAIGKKKITEFLAPRIKRIENDIFKAHYTKKLAELINLSEELVMKAEYTAQNKHQSDKTNYRNSSENGEKSPNDRPLDRKLENVHKIKEDKEELFIYLIKADKNLFKKFFGKINKGKLLKKEDLEILEKYNSKVVKGTTTLESFVNKNTLQDVFLTNLGSFEESTETQILTLQKLYNRYKRNRIKEKIEELTHQIKQAEIQDNSQILDKMQKKFTILARQLSRL